MSGGRCWPLPLPAAELVEWMALRRVRGGGVACWDGWWLDFGRPVPCYLVEPLDDVARVGLVALVEIPTDHVSRAELTEDGSARYHTLCERRGIPLAARDPISLDLPIRNFCNGRSVFPLMLSPTRPAPTSPARKKGGPLINSLPLAEMVRLAQRSLRFAPGTFTDTATAGDARLCERSARNASAAAVMSAHPLLCVARAAWWSAVAAQVSGAADKGR